MHFLHTWIAASLYPSGHEIEGSRPVQRRSGGIRGVRAVAGSGWIVDRFGDDFEGEGRADERSRRPTARIESAQARWRAITGAHRVPLVRAGARFENGVLVERDEAAA
ncbi:hypothetical protein [Streptomyces aureus]|uniref:Uncharacterized protein n=1 Tax=Streptomyces aureus TaxID=193461 RepID=A0ABV4T2L2_9ACTN